MDLKYIMEQEADYKALHQALAEARAERRAADEKVKRKATDLGCYAARRAHELFEAAGHKLMETRVRPVQWGGVDWRAGLYVITGFYPDFGGYNLGAAKILKNGQPGKTRNGFYSNSFVVLPEDQKGVE